MFLSKLIRILHREGLRGLFLRVVSRLYQKTYIYHVDIDNANKSIKNNDYLITPLAQELLNKMLAEYRAEISPEKETQIMQRIKEKSTDKVFVVMKNKGDVLGYCCLSYAHNYDETMDYTFYLGPDKVLIFDCYIFEKHRNRGVFTSSIISLLEESERQGYQAAASMVDDHNIHSEKAFVKTGFKRIKEIYTLNLLLKKFNITHTARSRIEE